jgi:hypothetical protein
VAPPGPHCTDALEELQLVYLKDLFGSKCDVVPNTQDGKAKCKGDDLTGDDVTIQILTSPSSISATPDMGIDEGDIFSIVRSGGGPKLKLPKEIKFIATDGNGNMQEVKIHTSCSKNLDLGNRFGDFAVFGMDRGDGDTGNDGDTDTAADNEDGLITLGCEIEYQYAVTNPNATAVENVQIDDDKAGLIADDVTLAPGETQIFFKERVLQKTTTNQAIVTGDLVGGGQCEAAEDSVTVTVTLPPDGPFNCKDAKPIDELTMEWAGAGDIRIRAWKGFPNDGALLADIDDISPGDLVSVSGMGGSPNTQAWEIFLAGTLTKIGESQFHISCSDGNMNGVEDCGTNQGDGKSDSFLLNNDWLFQGMSGRESFSCLPTIIPADVGGGGCGLGAELVLLLPGLMWLARRRRE